MTQHQNYSSSWVSFIKKDAKKFFAMALMMFLILLDQNVVRIVKDSIVSINIGPEVISFIKLYIEMPAGLLFCLIYAKMCNKMSTEWVFRIIFTFFIFLFLAFALFILPNKESLHPDPEYVKSLIASYPYIRWFIEMYGKWIYVLLYVTGELYPMIVFTLLFWHLANKITAPDEAAKFYPLIGVIGHTNMLCCKYVVPFLSNPNNFGITLSGDPGEIVYKSLLIGAFGIGLLVLAIHYYIDKTIVQDTQFVARVANEPLKLSLKESFRVIVKSKYLALISILTISYSMSINLIEGLWMSKAKELYSNSADLIYYQTNVLFYTGCMTIFISIIANFSIRRLGWMASALCAPIAILIGGSLFYSAVFLQDYLYLIGITSALSFVVLMGGIQNIVGKGTKYSLFDDTKEMAYIPLNKELKTKGKAAVDIIGGKIGKSSGAIIQFIFFSLFPYASFVDISGYLFIMFIAVCMFWISAVVLLSKEYRKLLEVKEV